MTTPMTLMRTAVWDAINNWAALQSSGTTPINRKFRFDNANDGIDDIRPAYTDMTALSVWPGRVTPDAWVNRQHRYRIPYEVHVWTKDWLLTTAEQAINDVMNAVYKSGPDIITAPTATYVRNATGHHPVNNGPYTMQRVFVNDTQQGQKAIYTRWEFSLQTSSDPYPR